MSVLARGWYSQQCHPRMSNHSGGNPMEMINDCGRGWNPEAKEQSVLDFDKFHCKHSA